VTRLDLDVEDNSLNNLAGIDRRNKAIAKHILTNALDNHARITVVNIMTFDYYDDAAHEMAADTETAATALVGFLHTLVPAASSAQLWSAVGVTEMIGHDDYGSGGETGPAEIFTLDDARTVTAWATARHLGELSFWALNRDKSADPDPTAGCVVGTAGGDTCSGIAQKPWQFTHIMAPFTR
jgi:hypothetical protein